MTNVVLILMITLYLLRNGKIYYLHDNSTVNVGDTIILGADYRYPSVSSELSNLSFQIRVISPIGALIDVKDINTQETGLKRIYSFPVLSSLYSGGYVFQLLGDFNKKWKIFVRTPNKLINNHFLSYAIYLSNPNDFPLNNVYVDVALPPFIYPIQEVSIVKTNYPPQEMLGDKDGNRWVRFYLPQLEPKEQIIFAYKAIITNRLESYELKSFPENEDIALKYQFKSIYSQYTQPEPFIESDDKEIQEIAQRFSDFNPVAKILAFLRYIKRNITFRRLNRDYGAKFAIKYRYGDCTEFATLFISLCRAAYIPARLVTGIIPTNEGWDQHALAEVFVNGIWIPIDPTLGTAGAYFTYDPKCIILQRGNSLKKSPTKEIRFKYDDMHRAPLNIRFYKDVKMEARKIGDKIEIISTPRSRALASMFKNIDWHYPLYIDTADDNSRPLKIRAVVPESVSAFEHTKLPIHLYNYSSDKLNGALKVSIRRGGCLTLGVLSMEILPKSQETVMIDIPAINFMGDAVLEFTFQEPNGKKHGIEIRKIHFL